MRINGGLEIDNMDSINKKHFESLILFSRKNDFYDKTLTSRIFEIDKHNFNSINDISFTTYSAENEIKINNQLMMEKISDQTIEFQDLYFVSVSSNIYGSILNEIKIPTREFNGSQDTLIRCTISLSHDTYDFEKAKICTLLSFLNVPIGQNILITQDVYESINKDFNRFVNLTNYEEITYNCKNIVLDKIDNEYQILSTVNQIHYRQCVNTILSYKNNNADHKHDNSRLDNLQYYLIEQQLRFKIYSVFKKILEKNPIKFRSHNSLHEFNGNLFFNLEYPKKDVGDYYSVKQISEYITQTGFFLSYSDATEKVKFNQNIDHQSKPVETTHTLTADNTIYPLLFRLCDQTLIENQEEINSYITDSKNEELFMLIEKILTG